MSGIHERALAIFTCVVIAALMACPLAAAAEHSEPESGNGTRKITICHQTGSTSNPYVTITVDENGLSGHGGHGGDLVPAPGGGCPARQDTCDERGLPCTSIPFAPSHWSVLLAGAVGAGVVGWRRRKKHRGTP